MPTDAIASAPLTSRPRSSHAARGRAATIALWALQIALAVALGGAGLGKLAGAPEMVQLFDAVGIGQWLRYVTGTLELLGSILLLVPAGAGAGALLLAGVMSGAIVSHLLVLDTPPTAPLGLLAGLAIVCVARRADILARIARLRGGAAAQPGTAG